MIDLYLARHGETEENVAQVLQGLMPGHLTPTGQAQAAALREELERQDVRPAALLVSCLQRAVETACIVNEAFGLPLTTTPLLQERDWGSLTGVSLKGNRISEFPPDVESVDEMFARARRFLTFLSSDYDGCCVLAIGHGLFNRVIQAALRGVTIAEVPRMQNAEVRRLTVSTSAQAEPMGRDASADTISAN